MTAYTLTDFPKDLQKKVTLLQHFRSYLETNSQGTSSQPSDVDMLEDSKTTP